MKYIQKNTETKIIKIDEKDKQILSLLSNNVRIPATTIAKNVKLSRDAVAYRIQNYENRGLIQGHLTIIDISKFGFDNYHMFIKLSNHAGEIEKLIIEKICKHPFIRAVLTFNGNYDIEVALVAKNVSDLDNCVTAIINDCQGEIQEHEVLALPKNYCSYSLPKKFISKDKSKIISDKNKLTYFLNKKDIEILKLIGRNATATTVSLSKKVNLSADAVAYRIKKMQEAKVILKFVPIFNYTVL